LCACTVNLTSRLPFPKIFNPELSFVISLSCSNNSLLTTVPSAYLLRSLKLTIAYSFLLTLVNPLFLSLLKYGVCPPSKPKRVPPPEREF